MSWDRGGLGGCGVALGVVREAALGSSVWALMTSQVSDPSGA
jgi:hypothetical protein